MGKQISFLHVKVPKGEQGCRKGRRNSAQCQFQEIQPHCLICLSVEQPRKKGGCGEKEWMGEKSKAQWSNLASVYAPYITRGTLVVKLGEERGRRIKMHPRSPPGSDPSGRQPESKRITTERGTSPNGRVNLFEYPPAPSP